MENAANQNIPISKVQKQGPFVIMFKQLRKNTGAMIGLYVFGLLVLLAIIAPFIAPYDYKAINVPVANSSPSLAHLAGTDQVGRDIFSRLLIGARYSLTLGVMATLIGTVIGVFFGCLAGYFGGTTDEVIMRITDIFQSIPGMVLNVALACAIGVGFWKTIFVLSVPGIAGSARLIRAQILKIRTMEYIEAADVINCSHSKTIVKHLLPNAFSPILVNMTMRIGGSIMAAAGLSYLGLGVLPPTPELGAMLADGRNYLTKYPYMCIFPGIFIIITVLSLNLFGDGLRDALDPKLKK